MLAAPAPAPAHLLVTAVEWHLSLSRAAIKHGAASIQLSNRGQDAHDLVVQRGARKYKVAETTAGGLTTARFTLARGTYTLYCSLPGHRAAGMHAKLRVT